MKKLIVTVVLLSVFAAASPVFAQTVKEENQSEYYYVNIPVERIHIYRAGYIVEYRKGINKKGMVYLPYEWFTSAAAKGELVMLPRGAEWPTMTVFYKDGEFSHVRLYAHRWRGHRTWTVVPTPVNLDDRFKDVDTLKLEF
jgi:hypothetical protein